MGARRSWTDTRDVERSALCVCGWAGVFKGLREAQEAFEVHLRDASEGCDHAVDIADHQPEHQPTACPGSDT